MKIYPYLHYYAHAVGTEFFINGIPHKIIQHNVTMSNEPMYYIKDMSSHRSFAFSTRQLDEYIDGFIN